jgi:hypothetical protein
VQTVESPSDGLGEPQSVAVGISNLEVSRPRHLVDGYIRQRDKRLGGTDPNIEQPGWSDVAGVLR